MGIHGRSIRIIFSFIAVLLTAGVGQAEAESVAGEYVVKLKNQMGVMSTAAMQPLAASMNANLKSVVSDRSSMIVVKRSMVERADAVLAELNQHPMVELAEPNYIYRASALPNDEKLSELWGLVNQNKSSGGVDIDAERAWDITTGDSNVVVAVIDSGVNYNDPDLINNMWVNESEKNGEHGVDDDGNGYVDDIYGYDFANDDGDPMDDNNHGSHCAGTIGAEGNNGHGVAGVNWNVSIMAIKFLTGTGGGTLEAALKSIEYAIDNKADIMNNSWGGGGASQNLLEVIQRAEEAGILFVAAAGNSRGNNDVRPSYPASYDVANVVSVAAIGQNGKMANFSNYGKTSVHVAAPGVDILSTGKSGLMKMSGTSMAAPHVAGVAALLLAAEPDLSYAEIKERMLATSVALPSLEGKIAYGAVNAYNALTNSLPPVEEEGPASWDYQPEAVSTLHPYANHTDESFTITVPGAEQVSVHFAAFATEKNFDKVYFFDGLGNKIGEMTGENDDSFSPVAAGDTIVVQMVSDYSVGDYGFDIDRVHYVAGTRNIW